MRQCKPFLCCCVCFGLSSSYLRFELLRYVSLVSRAFAHLRLLFYHEPRPLTIGPSPEFLPVESGNAGPGQIRNREPLPPGYHLPLCPWTCQIATVCFTERPRVKYGCG